MTRLLIERALETNETVSVTGEGLHYVRNVRRLGEGDTVELLDTAGNRFEAALTRLSTNAVLIEVGPLVATAPEPLPVTLFVSVPKRTLMDEVIRMTSELGIESVVPIIAERTVVKPRETKVDRWRKIAWESRRQCVRAAPLGVSEVTAFEDAIKQCKTGTKILLDPTAPSPSAWQEPSTPAPVYALVGPEGGFTNAELEFAESLGFRRSALGRTILKVETAAVAAAVLCISLLGGYE